MEKKVSKLEVDMKVCQLQLEEIRKNHKREFGEVKVVVQTLQDGVNNITKLINSIKWWVIGAVSILAIKELGLSTLFFKILALL